MNDFTVKKTSYEYIQCFSYFQPGANFLSPESACFVGCILLSLILIPHTQNEESNYVLEMKIFLEQNVNERPWGRWLFYYINEANWKLTLNPYVCAYEYMQFKSLRFIDTWSGYSISLELIWSFVTGPHPAVLLVGIDTHVFCLCYDALAVIMITLMPAF